MANNETKKTTTTATEQRDPRRSAEGLMLELLRILQEIAETRSNPFHHPGIDAPAWGKLKDLAIMFRTMVGDIPVEVEAPTEAAG